ncbi:TetR/AcrR family transcriptional regulator [Paractinoplanes atraurantiacus]|uniref:Regulatory protein, tetR family n=1 Tax=Paractinoplanes atraurantiacus TaxID=1036182 RepID=A0A285GJ34_9ACTN|nr:TetR/AcrR family transcriptional regulator [Actinoplanes atraurantiacus]SNY23602.1 regulatory protein, tetR family [Actinoplanes atraurantiacus]
MRSDARDNRERILAAAREVFAADGLDVPMREIARRAEVGPATLYRRFPTKQALITEAFTEQMYACYAVVDEGLADPDAWRGLRMVVEKLFVLHAEDRGFARAFTDTAARERGVASLAELLHRAKAGGHLRPDVTVDDLILVLVANSGLRATSATTRVAASRRFAELTLRAFATSPDPGPPRT